MKIASKKLIEDHAYSSALQEIQKKLNELHEKMDTNEKKNNERYSKLLEGLQYE